MSKLLVTIGCIWLAAALTGLLLARFAPGARIEMARSLARHGLPGEEKLRTAVYSVVAGAVLTGVRLLAGILTGSLSILAAAADSGLDLVATLVTYLAVRLSNKPPDRKHLYGHGKVENLSALVEVLLLLATSGGIVQAALESLLSKNVAVQASIWAFLTMIFTIVVEVHRSRKLYEVARKHQSQALEADALRSRTHVWGSAVVIAGLACVKVADWFPAWDFLRKADAVAAVAVAAIVAVVSLKLGQRAVQALLDVAPEGVADTIRQTVETVANVAMCHPVRVRRSGSHLFVDAHAIMNGSLTLREAHDLTDEIEHRIRALLPEAQVTVHAEPSLAAKSAAEDRHAGQNG